MDCGQNGSMLKSLQFTKNKGGYLMAKLNQKQLDLKNYMIKNDWILEEAMEVVFIDCGFMNPPGINQKCDELKNKLTAKTMKEAA